MTQMQQLMHDHEILIWNREVEQLTGKTDATA